MPQCSAVKPELYAVDGTQVRCLLYTDDQGLAEADKLEAAASASTAEAADHAEASHE